MVARLLLGSSEQFIIGLFRVFSVFATLLLGRRFGWLLGICLGVLGSCYKLLLGCPGWLQYCC